MKTRLQADKTGSRELGLEDVVVVQVRSDHVVAVGVEKWMHSRHI